MAVVEVRNIKIGEGIPKICAPVIETSEDAIYEEARNLLTLPVDVVEWRVDWFEGVCEQDRVNEVLKHLREILRETPLLMTFRTAEEGGARSITPENYMKLNMESVKTGCLDMLDVQLYIGDSIVYKLITDAHRHGVKVICSNHDFKKTPGKDAIVGRLRMMQSLGADIPKIAVMPRSPHDVLTLLEATEEMRTCYADRPIITMSMAGTGTISRLCGEVFGSALTFGAAGKASAPGQIHITELKKILDLLHQVQ